MRWHALLSVIVAMVLMGWLFTPGSLAARDNVLTTGIGLSYDYDERNNEALVDDPETSQDEGAATRAEDDYQQIVIKPLVVLVSKTPRDSLELSLRPELRYDLVDDGTDWNGNFQVSVDRYLTKPWQVGLLYRYLRSDFHQTDSLIDATDEQAVIQKSQLDQIDQAVEPELSADIGRTRYTTHTAQLFTNYFYGEKSLVGLGFNSDFLRYDSDIFISQEDYDRFEYFVRNNHRFNAVWSSTLDARAIIGDYEPADQPAPDGASDDTVVEANTLAADKELSSDLQEYRVRFSLENKAIQRNPIALDYTYIGTRYDESLRNGGDIHEMRLMWRHDFSTRLSTRLGVGPTYEKTENKDARWRPNGIAALDYLFEAGSLFWSLEKRFDVDNFSGTRDRGASDLWDLQFGFNYSITQNLDLIGRLQYLYEDRSDPIVSFIADHISDTMQESRQQEDYHNDRYFAGIGLRQTFSQFYTAGIDYRFNKLESDLVGDDYDDHRLLLTLAWQKDIARW